MVEQDLDFGPDPVLEKDQGLVYGKPEEVLETLAAYREEGKSLTDIRRDFALPQRISNKTIERATDTAAGLSPERYSHRGKYFSIPAPWLK